MYIKAGDQAGYILVNEAGDVSEDVEVGRHFHVPALLFRATEGNCSRRTCVSVPFLLLTLFYSNGAIRKSRLLATNWKLQFLSISFLASVYPI